MQVPIARVADAPAMLLDTADTWGQTLVKSFNDAFGQIIEYLPNALAAVVVMVLGFIIARVLGGVAKAVSERLGLQTGAERGGLVASMQQVGIQRTVPSIVGQIVFWLAMCFFLMAACNVLGLSDVSNAMHELVKYIPKLVVATVVVVIGLLVATFLRGVIATSADKVGISYAQTLASGCYYVLALMTFIAAFDQLGIQFTLLREMILIAFAALALGFGLSFGLGGREVMGGILAGYYTRQRVHAGDHVSVAGLEGTVREVGPVATIIETEEDGLLNRRSIPNTIMINEAVR